MVDALGTVLGIVLLLRQQVPLQERIELVQRRGLLSVPAKHHPPKQRVVGQKVGELGDLLCLASLVEELKEPAHVLCFPTEAALEIYYIIILQLFGDC